MGDFVIYVRTNEEKQKLLALVREIKDLAKNQIKTLIQDKEISKEIKDVNKKILTADVIIKALEYYLLYLKQQQQNENEEAKENAVINKR